MYTLYILSFISKIGTMISSGTRTAASAYHTVHTEAVCIRIAWVALHTTDTSAEE
jgi:hypothetical protein